jgi:DNA-binding NarL/FixJ family response regulator
MEITSRTKLYLTEEQELYQKLYPAVFDANSPVQIIGSCEFADFKTLAGDLASLPVEILLIGCNTLSIELLHQLDQAQIHHKQLGLILLAARIKYEDLKMVYQYLTNHKSAFGFFLKKSITRSDQLFSLISLVQMKQVVIDTAFSNLVTSDSDKALLAGGLTAREMEILNLVAKGFTNVAIGDTLCIDVKTVRHHINNIYGKIQTSENSDNRHPRVTATNTYLKLTGQLSSADRYLE